MFDLDRQRWRSSPARRAASAARLPNGSPQQGATVVAAARGDHAAEYGARPSRTAADAPRR